MSNQDKKPLYKVLNEQRTQGRATIELRSFESSDLMFGNDRVGELYCGSEYTEIEAEANAQYTALAVNNLHLLAEALEKIKNECLKALARQAAGEEFSLKSLIGAIAETSVDALIRIS